MSRVDHAREVRNALADPVKLCHALGLAKHGKRQGGGMSVCCPVHGEKDPSCSVTQGPDGTVRVRCFACDFSADALGLIAAVHGLGLRAQFREVLAIGAELAGSLQLRDEILGGSPMPDRKPIAAPPPRSESDYPPAVELASLWDAAVPVSEDPDAWEALRARSVDSDALSPEVARVIGIGCAKTPSWCRWRGKTWLETGHRLLVAMFDATGTMRSVRGWRIEPGDSPKRLPPARCRATGLVMANGSALAMLRERWCPSRLVIVEGEPDFATACMLWRNDAIAGIVTGSWTPEFAQRVPTGTRVIIRTHNDDAGDRYAEQILGTLRGRKVWRAAA